MLRSTLFTVSRTAFAGMYGLSWVIETAANAMHIHYDRWTTDGFTVGWIQRTANCTTINGKLRGHYTLAARRLTVYCELVGSQWFSNVQNNGQQVGLTLGITY